MIDLSNFKLLKEDNESYQVAHPSGKALTISKQGLSDKAHAAIAKLKGAQGLDDGGETAGIDTVGAAPTPWAPEPTTDFYPIDNAPLKPEGYVAPAPEHPIEQPAPFSPMVNPPQESQTTPQPQTQQQQSQQANPFAAQQQLLQKEADLYDQQAKNVMAGGGAQQKAIAQMQTDLAAQAKTYQDAFKENQAKNEQLAQALQNQHLDPNKLWNESSTPAKVSASIGLILGGIGSGLTHQPNAALQVMDNAIQRDLQAQMNDKSDKMNLYKMNRENMGDQTQAYLATSNQMLTALKYKLDSAQIGNASQQAALNLQLAKNHVQQQMAQNTFNLSLMQDNATDPAVKVNYLVPQAEQAKAYDALDRVKTVAQNMSPILQAFDRAAQDIGGFSPIQGTKDVFTTNKDVGAIKVMMLPLLHDELGRPNPMAQEVVDLNLPKPFDFPENIAKKRNALIQFMNSESQKGSSMLQTHGINLGRYQQQLQRPQYSPGSIVQHGGQMYQIGQDANTMIPVK